ncbi:uncharacterized protein FIBRA_00767 [Fibroporia radiculosa]|uniref:C2H2-type domain-containing protein n=1 Tax=Fibroporia radiculosa TaxID=599839 RepID=J4HS57_9APHY|nr:uncharacterized protein FIBRA_00767 [Fibroporia radiculosa]CCL98762.1 predicted protein [Fibroporia radiculosa]
MVSAALVDGYALAMGEDFVRNQASSLVQRYEGGTRPSRASSYISTTYHTETESYATSDSDSDSDSNSGSESERDTRLRSQARPQARPQHQPYHIGVLGAASRSTSRAQSSVAGQEYESGTNSDSASDSDEGETVQRAWETDGHCAWESSSSKLSTIYMDDEPYVPEEPCPRASSHNTYSTSSGYSPRIGPFRAAANLHTYYEEKEADTDTAAEDGDDDDEFIPGRRPTGRHRYRPYARTSPPARSRRTSRSSRFSSGSTSTSSIATVSASGPLSPSPSLSSASPSAHPTSDIIRVPRARNTQTQLEEGDFAWALAQLVASGTSACPVPGCAYVQRRRRLPDLRRHMETHRAGTSYARWVCCGVSLAEADRYGLRIDNYTSRSMFRGEMRVGGCMRGFSRRDALVRHLKNGRIDCIAEDELHCLTKEE